MGAATLLALVTGCTTSTDDEMQARPTPTVTVTGEPVRELPDRLDLRSDVDLSDAVVWVDGSVVHVDDRPVDVAPLRPSRVIVLDGGVLALADEQVWFLAGRRAVGLPLPPTTSMDLSADGSQVVLRVADREEPVAWATDGVRVPDDAVSRTRTDERTDEGPGVVTVRRGAAGASVVTTSAGEVVEVPGLPDAFRVTGWTGPDAFFGTTASGDVVSCTVQAAPACTTLGSVAPGEVRALVFGDHPAG